MRESNVIANINTTPPENFVGDMPTEYNHEKKESKKHGTEEND